MRDKSLASFRRSRKTLRSCAAAAAVGVGAADAACGAAAADCGSRRGGTWRPQAEWLRGWPGRVSRSVRVTRGRPVRGGSLSASGRVPSAIDLIYVWLMLCFIYGSSRASAGACDAQRHDHERLLMRYAARAAESVTPTRRAWRRESERAARAWSQSARKPETGAPWCKVGPAARW